MKVVLISDNGQRHRKITVNIWLHIVLPILLLVVGISFVSQFSRLSQISFSSSQLSNSDKKAHDNFSQVLNKLSVLDAEVQRLNTLSTHIASKNKLDITNFNLSNVPAQGGAIERKYFGSSVVRSNDIKQSVDKIERNIDKQKLKLKNLVVSLEIKEVEEFLENLSNSTKVIENNRKERGRRITYDFSTPMKKGYISSPFGDRRDPINGSLRHHGGLDIAAKKGSNIYAIANGFVSFSGERGAYGKLLEVNHSESLKSRYAHLDKYLVKKGQLVKKGDLIGKVGATGRVTGPHLHLEIRENNKIIDPKVYLKDALSNF
jgi:murein DD-endopeptidase MepM/ murein hydrolase activator NlpD